MQAIAKAATFIHRVDRVALRNLFFHPGQQLGSAKLLRRPNPAPLTLYRRHNVAQVHVQAQFPYPAFCFFATGL